MSSLSERQEMRWMLYTNSVKKNSGKTEFANYGELDLATVLPPLELYQPVIAR
jgi:hypothetical protein